jgi:hypothetical protein
MSNMIKSQLLCQLSYAPSSCGLGTHMDYSIRRSYPLRGWTQLSSSLQATSAVGSASV